MGCDYNIIDHLEKFSQFALKKAYFNCKFCGNSPEVANWAIMITIGPRADHDHDYPVGDFSTAAAVAARPANSSSSSASSASSPGQITEKFRLAAMEENFSKWSIMWIMSDISSLSRNSPCRIKVLPSYRVIAGKNRRTSSE